MSSKVSNIVNKLGSLDEFSETVRQLNSAASLPRPPAGSSFQHPWATVPVSVAAQAAINLAARLRASSKDHSIRDQYWKSGCLSPLVVNLLGGKELDKVHAALMALSAISDICDNQEILDELVQLDSLTVLVKITQTKTVGEGARMTAAGVIRNVVGKSKNFKKEYIRIGGLAALVDLLEFDPSRATDEQYAQWILERVNDARDYLEDQTGNVDEAVAQALVSLNVRERLEKLKESKDNDIIEDSIDVLNLLAKY